MFDLENHIENQTSILEDAAELASLCEPVAYSPVDDLDFLERALKICFEKGMDAFLIAPALDAVERVRKAVKEDT